MHRLLQTKRRGFAIALAMLAIVILSAAGLGLLRLGQQSRIRARRNTSDIAAKRAADADLTKALVLMNQALNAKKVQIANLPKTTNEILPNCEAVFSCTVTKDTETETYVIESTGTYGRSSRTINAALRLKSPFESAIPGKNSSTINNKTCGPEKLKIYGLNNCQQMRFKNSSSFYGAIYAPNADITFYNSADAFGSVAAKGFGQKNSAEFHYDASLRDLTLNDNLVRFVIKTLAGVVTCC